MEGVTSDGDGAGKDDRHLAIRFAGSARFGIAVHREGMAVNAVGDAQDGIAHCLFGPGDHFVRKWNDAWQAELFEELQKSGPTDIVRGRHGIEVADDAVRFADVGSHDAQEFLIGNPATEEVRDRDEQAFLVEFARIGREGTTANVGDMADGAEEGDKLG